MRETSEALREQRTTETGGNWSGTVLLWEEQAIFYGNAADASPHESPAIKVCISLNDNFLLSGGENDGPKEYDSAIIPPGTPHAIFGGGRPMIMLVLVPEAELARPLAPIYGRQAITRLRPEVVSRIRSLFAGFEAGGEASIDEDICRQMIEAIAADEPHAGAEITIDPRVAQSIEWIRSGHEEGVTVKEIAAGVELSESRFSHLFTENVRIPVRRYLLWLRLRDAIHLLAGGVSLTDAAYEAGFADSSHLTRTFRGMLGITPSALIKESHLRSFLR